MMYVSRLPDQDESAKKKMQGCIAIEAGGVKAWRRHTLLETVHLLSISRKARNTSEMLHAWAMQPTARWGASAS